MTSKRRAGGSETGLCLVESKGVPGSIKLEDTSVDSAPDATDEYCLVSEAEAGNRFRSPNVMVGKRTEDIVRNRLAVTAAALVMSIAIACSNDEPAERASSLDSALTTIVSSEGTPSPPQIAEVRTPTSGGATSAGGALSAVGPGLSVADAIASTLEGPLLVNGFIFTEAGDVWLCSSLLHGDPTPADLLPGSAWGEHAMCGEPIIEVSGLDPATVEGFQLHEGAGWTNEPTQVLGVKVDGVLTVSGTTLAR